MKNLYVYQRLAPVVSAQHKYDAGLDLRSVDDLIIRPGEVTLIETDTSVIFPKEFVGLVSLRSSYASGAGVFMMNSPGVIDAGYRGAIMVAVSCVLAPLTTISKGERFAQLVVVKRARLGLSPVRSEKEYQEIEEEHDARGTGGFGSTGRF